VVLQTAIHKGEQEFMGFSTEEPDVYVPTAYAVPLMEAETEIRVVPVYVSAPPEEQLADAVPSKKSEQTQLPPSVRSQKQSQTDTRSTNPTNAPENAPSTNDPSTNASSTNASSTNTPSTNVVSETQTPTVTGTSGDKKEHEKTEDENPIDSMASQVSQLMSSITGTMKNLNKNQKTV
jgi:cell pole-organizing protein PopZ